MRRGDLLSSFTPSTMAPETLEAIFVKREPLARQIVESVDGAVTHGDIEHHIAVGPRGMGKTHLLSLVTHRVQTAHEESERLVVAWLREEEWGISSAGELYEQILRQLGNGPGTPASVRSRSAAALEALAGLTLEDLADRAEHHLPEVVEGLLLVVVVENLDQLFADIGADDQHRLRAFLQNHRNTVLLASTPSLSPSIAQRSGLFFGFFAIHHLEELTIDEARQLLIAIANLRDDDDGRRLIEYLATDEATRRLQVVQHLAGGHPRLWVLMAECITTERLAELIGLLMAVLDDLTPYYQAQMKSLSPQQRKIVTALSKAEGALPVKEIAARTRMQEKSAAKQLGDLTTLGFVRLATLPSGVNIGDRRIRSYELREPMLRHVLDIKDSRGRPLQIVVRFLRAWFDDDRLSSWASDSNGLVPGYAAAALESGASPRRRRSTVEIHEALADERFEDALKACDIELAKNPFDVEVRTLRADALWRSGLLEESLAEYDIAIANDPSNSTIHSHRGAVLGFLGRTQEAIVAFQTSLSIDEGNTSARYNLGVALDKSGRDMESLKKYREVLDIAPAHTEASWNYLLKSIETFGTVPEDSNIASMIANAPSDTFLTLNLAWLLDQVAASEISYTFLETVVQTICLNNKSDVLLEAITFHLSRSTQSELQHFRSSWFGDLADVLRANRVDGSAVDLLTTLGHYDRSNDGSVLLRLPEEIRELAYQVLGFTPQAGRAGAAR